MKLTCDSIVVIYYSLSFIEETFCIFNGFISSSEILCSIKVYLNLFLEFLLFLQFPSTIVLQF